MGRPLRKRLPGPRLPSSLRRELLSQTPPDLSPPDDQPLGSLPDVYEYEEHAPPEESSRNRRYDDVDQLEYELPSDFEDEEINEDTASGDETANQLQSRLSRHKIRKRGSRKKAKDLPSDEEEEEEDYVEHAGVYNHAIRRHLSPIDDNAEEDAEDDDLLQQHAEESEKETDDEVDHERHRRMVDAVTKSKFMDHYDKKHKNTALLTEAYAESEFNVRPLADNLQQISVEDLMMPLQGTTGFGSLRKRMQQLQKRGAPVDVPLPKVLQERLNRQAGYEKTSEEISRWQEIVKKNREAPTLVFNKRTDLTAVSTAELSSKFEPSTELEKDVALLLQESGLTDANIDAGKMLQFNKITVNEVKERQERLAKMRNLLFYHEGKAKRMKKIKSKAFHRILQKDRKTKERFSDTKDELDPEAMKEAMLRQEFRRAQERMTLKHKNTSRWAKRIIKRGLKAKDDGSRDAIAEQLRTHTSLTRKMHSVDNASSSDDSSDKEGFDSDAPEPGKSLTTKPKARLLAKAKMETLKVLEDDAEAEIPTTGLFSLPFMTRAIEKKRMHAHTEALGVLEQLEQLENVDAKGDGFLAPENTDEARESGTNTGRLAFGTMAKLTSGSDKPKFEDLDMLVEEGSNSEDGLEDENMHPIVQDTLVASKKRKAEHNLIPREDNVDTNRLSVEVSQGHELPVEKVSGDVGECLHMEEGTSTVSISNPWLFGDSKNQSLVCEATEGLKSLGTGNMKSAKKKKKRADVQSWPGHTKKNKEPLVTSTGGTHVTIAGGSSTMKGFRSVNNVEEVKIGGGSLDKAKPLDVPSAEQTKMPSSPSISDTEEFTNKEMAEQGFGLFTGNGSQAELIQRAFAGDNVEADFEQLKAQALDEEVPSGETAVSLPGWGQWTGVQQKKGQPLWMQKQQEELEIKRNLALSKRKDSNLKYVMISEKMDKKAVKFLSPSLPFPFKSQETFERSIRMPIGRDFNTDNSFRDMIRPSVVRDAGVIIDPIKYKMSEGKKESDSVSFPTKRGGKRGSASVYKPHKIDLQRSSKSKKIPA